ILRAKRTGIRSMVQDTDVARVAAALRAPIIRYRNFGNVPVRGTTNAENARISPEFSLLDAALAEAAALHEQEQAHATALTATPGAAPLTDTDRIAVIADVTQPLVDHLPSTVDAGLAAEFTPQEDAIAGEVIVPSLVETTPLP